MQVSRFSFQKGFRNENSSFGDTGFSWGAGKGVKLIPLSCPKNKFLEAVLHTFKGLFAAKKIKPDILHMHAVGPSLFVPLARLMGFKVVMTHHCPDYQRQKWNKIAKFILRLGEKWGCSCANVVICVAEPIAEDIRKKYNREVEAIPNGVDLRAQGHKYTRNKSTR